MGFSVETGVPVITVFIQGILSFFSPCVLPLVPLYVSYLAGGTKTVDENGIVHYPRKKVLINTLFFVLGISFTFFLLGFGFSAMGRFFTNNRVWFARISGIIMIMYGLYQLGVIGRSETIEREHRLPFRLDRFSMNPLVALLLGFTFSFAWTPCVGPTLGSVLLMASSSSSSAKGFLLVGVYTLGFVIPFLAVGIFTGSVLDFFKKKRNVVKYTVKVGAALLILMGVMTLTGFMNGITSYLSKAQLGDAPEQSQITETENAAETVPENVPETASNTPSQPGQASSESDSSGTAAQESTQAEEKKTPAPDFTLVDQYGETHTLSDYKGKTVFLNFWATWCPPCKGEMPDIQALYEKYGENSEDLVVLGIANPKSDEYPYNQDGTQEEVEKLLSDSGYSFPVVMDTTGEIFSVYGIRSFPTTFMIDKDGNVFGYAQGALSPDMMESIVSQTMTGKRVQ